MACASFCPAGWAAVSVTVRDSHQQPVADAVIVATADAGTLPAIDTATAAVMDQVHKAFVPTVLVVRAGASVIFPNSDTIAHQVYSFSPPKRFKLGLYRGHPHPPVRFDTPGLVVLGCNIHDRMVGYIFVTDSAYFGTSDQNGRWVGELPAGKYRISVWTPQSTREVVQFEQWIVVGDTQPQQLEIRLSRTTTQSRAAAQDPRVREY
jgi:plastocyanin